MCQHLPLPLPCPSPSGVCLAADSDDTRLTWLGALRDAGIEILPELEDTEELLRNAKSLFEFEAKSIDGEVVDLSRYRLIESSVCGKLTLLKWKALSSCCGYNYIYHLVM